MNVRLSTQQGVVLPLTLIIVAILTMMASLLLMRGNDFIEDGRRNRDLWQAELKIKAAEQRVLMAIMAGKQYSGAYVLGDIQIRIDGTPIKLSNDVWVSVQDQSGMLSLRFLRKSWLLALLRSYVNEPLATQIVDSIIRFQVSHTNSQGSSDAATFQGRGAPFRSLDELMLILGISPALYNGHYNLDLDHPLLMGGEKSPVFGLRDLLAVSGSSNINFAAIPEAILKRVLKLSTADIKYLDDMKSRGNWKAVSKKIAELGWPEAMVASIPSSFYIMRFQYKGIKARGDYQVRSTTTPPRKRAWYFPDDDRYFIDSNRYTEFSRD